jgi:septal ring factor EnvC (AmiA/AmiB activator)
LRDAFEREIKPRGIIEQMYVHDICSIVWEILRLRRCKVVIINSAFRSALEDLLERALRQPGQDHHDSNKQLRSQAEALTRAWFTDKEAKKQVSEILSEFELDESAIEAEAIRRTSSDLELLDRMLTSLESRRDKALGCVAEYRASLAQQLRESADRILDGKVLRLEPEPNKRSTVA